MGADCTDDWEGASFDIALDSSSGDEEVTHPVAVDNLAAELQQSGLNDVQQLPDEHRPLEPAGVVHALQEDGRTGGGVGFNSTKTDSAPPAGSPLVHADGIVQPDQSLVPPCAPAQQPAPEPARDTAQRSTPAPPAHNASPCVSAVPAVISSSSDSFEVGNPPHSTATARWAKLIGDEQSSYQAEGHALSGLLTAPSSDHEGASGRREAVRSSAHHIPQVASRGEDACGASVALLPQSVPSIGVDQAPGKDGQSQAARSCASPPAEPAAGFALVALPACLAALPARPAVSADDAHVEPPRPLPSTSEQSLAAEVRLSLAIRESPGHWLCARTATSMRECGLPGSARPSITGNMTGHAIADGWPAFALQAAASTLAPSANTAPIFSTAHGHSGVLAELAALKAAESTPLAPESDCGTPRFTIEADCASVAERRAHEQREEAEDAEALQQRQEAEGYQPLGHRTAPVTVDPQTVSQQDAMGHEAQESMQRAPPLASVSAQLPPLREREAAQEAQADAWRGAGALDCTRAAPVAAVSAQALAEALARAMASALQPMDGTGTSGRLQDAKVSRWAGYSYLHKKSGIQHERQSLGYSVGMFMSLQA